MSSEKTSQEDLVESFDGDSMPSVDDFIKELEEKEKDLDISSDLVIEVGESSVVHENIHDSFVTDFEIEAANVPVAPEPKPHEDPEAVSAEAFLNSNEDEFHELMEERDELMDALRRQKIDFENYRSRTERDRANTFNGIVSGLAAQVLPVIDNLERALDSVSGEKSLSETEVQKFIEGIVLVNHQMTEVLMEMGVEPINAVGQPFDPNLHDAVDLVPTDDVPPKTVIGEMMRGYRIGDRVIRPSMVNVSEALPASEEENAASSDADHADETDA